LAMRADYGILSGVRGYNFWGRFLAK
jgi:hypothetical protein